MIALPTSASAIPPSAPEERPRLREEVHVQRAQTLEDHGAEHEREDRDGRQGGDDPQAGHQLFRDTPASEPVRRASDVVRVDGLVDGAHAALRAFSKRRTISWAATLVTSEIAIRIAAR